MPVKILLADKSITIQKVVEMLFSGKEYEVVCVSDGETGLREAERVVPDVVLADVDLPRINGYTFSSRLKESPAVASTPVILMLSRDDVFDEARGREASIVDHIAKPFESQDLIGKVKKAVSGAPSEAAVHSATPISRPAPAAPRPVVPAAPAAPVKPIAKPKQAPPPTDIFDLIQEAPTQAEIKRAGATAPEEENVFEVEPVVEVEEPVTAEIIEEALPVGRKAVEEMRAGLGVGDNEIAEPEIVNFESLDIASKVVSEKNKPKAGQRPAPESFVPRAYVPPPPGPESEAPAPHLSEERLVRIADEVVSRMAREYFKDMAPPPPPKISEESVQRGIEEEVSRIAREIAREVIEKVAWEVIPDMAEMLIKAEIERLRAET